MSELFDENNSKSIEIYAQKVIGKTFREIWKMNKESNRLNLRLSDKTTTDDYASGHNKKKYKGGLGNLIEECYFKYKANNDSNPDFASAGVELKVTPYKKTSVDKICAKERLIITMIDYFKIVKVSFEESHVWKKSRLILLIWYLYEKDKENLDFHIDYVKLFSPPREDIKIMKADYDKIAKKVRDGKAHELSESDTLYLGAATKASTSADRRAQPYSCVKAKPRAFSFKNSYMTYILNKYFLTNEATYEPIIKHGIVDDFEEYVVSKINDYRGKSVNELCELFNIDSHCKWPKNLGAMLAFRILGIKSNNAEEFEKANIVIKTIRLQNNGKMRESMSFPTFKFKELVKEVWEDSALATYLRETRFFFVVYKYDDNDNLVLRGGQFWNIPHNDLEVEVRAVWEKTKNVLNEGLKISHDCRGRRLSNFPKKSENRVSHVRPHAKNQNDVDELPDGRLFPKQCFWLNNTYILEQLNESLK